MNLNDKFPPLYQCSVCKKSVQVIPNGEGVEPTIKRKCDHVDATVWANRKVTLRGKGNMNIVQKTQIKIKLTFRQLLSAITGRSI